jgi:hypothetical protein
MPGQSFVDQLFSNGNTDLRRSGRPSFGEQGFRAQHVVFCAADEVISGEPGIAEVLVRGQPGLLMGFSKFPSRSPRIRRTRTGSFQ